jgi:hypothetical protein
MEKRNLVSIDDSGIMKKSKEAQKLYKKLGYLKKKYGIRDVTISDWEWTSYVSGFNCALDRDTGELVIYDLGCT